MMVGVPGAKYDITPMADMLLHAVRSHKPQFIVSLPIKFIGQSLSSRLAPWAQVITRSGMQIKQQHCEEIHGIDPGLESHGSSMSKKIPRFIQAHEDALLSGRIGASNLT